MKERALSDIDCASSSRQSLKNLFLAPFPASCGIFVHLLRWLRGTTVVAAVKMLHQIHLVLSQGCTLNHHQTWLPTATTRILNSFGPVLYTMYFSVCSSPILSLEWLWIRLWQISCIQVQQPRICKIVGTIIASESFPSCSATQTGQRQSMITAGIAVSSTIVAES